MTFFTAHPSTTTMQLSAGRTWINLNGWKCLVTRITPSIACPTVLDVTVDVYDTNGTKVDTRRMESTPHTVWTVADAPKF